MDSWNPIHWLLTFRLRNGDIFKNEPFEHCRPSEALQTNRQRFNEKSSLAMSSDIRM